MLGNRVLLKWKEPRFAETYAISQLKLKDYFLAYGKYIWKWALGSFLFFSFLRYISPRTNYTFIDLEIISVVLFIVASVSVFWLITLFLNLKPKAEVSIREKDIMCMSMTGADYLKYKNIQSCSIGKSVFNGLHFNFLEIKLWDGNKAFIEIDPSIDSEKVIEILKGRNVQIKPSLFNVI